MDYMTDFTMLCLTVGLLLGGVALGHRLGAVVACWGVGGAWLALRFADRMWRPTFSEMLKGDTGLDMEFWLPMSYGLLFVGLFAFVAIWIALLKPRAREIALPAEVNDVVAMAAGACTGALLVMAAVQSQVMLASSEARMPHALGIVRPALSAVGQEHIAPPPRPNGAPGQGMGN